MTQDFVQRSAVFFWGGVVTIFFRIQGYPYRRFWGASVRPVPSVTFVDRRPDTNLLAKRAPFHEAHQRSRRPTTKIFWVVNGSHPSHPHSLERFLPSVCLKKDKTSRLPRPTLICVCVWNLCVNDLLALTFSWGFGQGVVLFVCGSRPQQQILLRVVSPCFWIDVARPYLHCCYSTRRGKGIRGRL